MAAFPSLYCQLTLTMTKPTVGDIKASVFAARYVIEVERKVDDRLECRYFIESISSTGDDPTPPKLPTTITQSTTSPESTPIIANSESPTETALPGTEGEETYLEVHPKDVFVGKNPDLWKGSNAL